MVCSGCPVLTSCFITHDDNAPFLTVVTSDAERDASISARQAASYAFAEAPDVFTDECAFNPRFSTHLSVFVNLFLVGGVVVWPAAEMKRAVAHGR